MRLCRRNLLLLVAIFLFSLCSFCTFANSYSYALSQHFNHVFRRKLDDGGGADDDQAQGDDDAAAAGDDKAMDDDLTAGDNEMCAKYLFSFLEGVTDARDTCEGIMNAYVAAKCKGSDNDSSGAQDDDDYFNRFAEKQCCQALQKHHSDYCDEESLLSNANMIISAAVLLMCECFKVMVAKLQIKFLPEAAVCILVGMFVGVIAHYLSDKNSSIDDLPFDDELFLSLLLPPIIFEAALSVSKYEFKRRRGAIFMFSVFGTVISTFLSGLMVHYASVWLAKEGEKAFPMLDSLVFGALISSIDPVAILSVLSSLNLDQRDTIFILVFGESLLNDGIAITVFQTLVHRFDGRTTDGTTSLDEILDALATFLISMFGSIAVALACGCGAWVYFNFLGDMLPPVMEVGSFFLWALIPYYICDAVGWSGIVSIVAVGFFMDVYIAGPKKDHTQHETLMDYHNFSNDSDSTRVTRDSAPTVRSMNPLPRTERIHLSPTADKHVRFVAHLTSTLSENAIFSYLGLFLFSNNYDWDPKMISISIFSCIMSRAVMVVVVAFVIFNIYRCRGVDSSGVGLNSSRTAAAIQDRRTQAVLVLAGLRGAVSLALVENVPMYNHVTKEGCEFKQIMKGMTSACILFTTFVFGGGAYYILPHLGVQSDGSSSDMASPLDSQDKRPTITVTDKSTRNNTSSMTFQSAC